MRRKVWMGISMAVALGLLGGCAHDRPVPAPSDKSQEYRSNMTPPPGQGRVYVLPTYSKGLYSDLKGEAAIAIFPDASNRGVRLASTTHSMFVAFDIAPGTYDLEATGEAGVARVTKSLVVAAGSTYFLRPVFYRSARDIPTDLSQTTPGLGFDDVNPDVARMQIQRMTMAALSSSGQAFLDKTMGAGAQAPTVAPVVQGQPAPTVVPVPTQNNFQIVEEKLRNLQKLRDEGLITQQDYDERRRSILNAF